MSPAATSPVRPAQPDPATDRVRTAMPETWDWNWRDLRKDRMRQVLGYLIDEDPPDDPVPFPA